MVCSCTLRTTLVWYVHILQCISGDGFGVWESARADWDVQIVNPKGEMKGSAITGPVGKEAAELWPVSIPFTSTCYILEHS